MSYPASVQYFARRLSGHTTNVFKLLPNGSPGVSANSGLGSSSILVFELPSNTLLDLTSLQMWCNAAINNTGSAASDKYGRLPSNLSLLIERYSLEAGGQTIAQGFTSYGFVKSVKDALTKKTTCQNAYIHKDIPRTHKDYDVNSPTLENEANESNTLETPFMIGDWCGILGEAKPQIIDTSLLGSLVLKIFLADNVVLSQSSGIVNGVVGTGTGDPKAITSTDATKSFLSSGPGGATYAIWNVNMHCTVYGINDGAYDMMIESQLNEVGFLEVPFTNYQTFFDGNHSGSTRFNLATQSLDMLYAVWRHYATPAVTNGSDFALIPETSVYTKQGAPIRVAGTLTEVSTLAQAQGSNINTGFGREFNGEALYSKGEQYRSKFVNFPKPQGLKTAQFQLNGSMYPQWQANPDEWLGLTKDAVKVYENEIESKAQWEKNYHVHAIRLNHPGSSDLRVLSGLDTRSMNLSGSYNTTGDLTGGVTGMGQVYPLTIIAQMTNTLRIGKGLAVNLII